MLYSQEDVLNIKCISDAEYCDLLNKYFKKYIYVRFPIYFLGFTFRSQRSFLKRYDFERGRELRK